VPAQATSTEPAANGEEPSWPDESAESAFLAEARDRGDVVIGKTTAPEPEESDPKALPPLDVLVQRIPPEVRETLEDLFRARFVRVQKLPRAALKSKA
jgi:hypothetical protein